MAVLILIVVDNGLVRYVPFCHNWICSCWIVRIDGKLYAKFNRILTLVGHDYNVKHLIDDEEDI